MLSALIDDLRLQIAFDKNLEDVTSIFFCGLQVYAALEISKTSDVIENPLLQPKRISIVLRRGVLFSFVC